ncbi:hypothetical protein [Francisella tularensis]|uniref:hypothetical protein n=1 Tax=Francisella tularensis TaxID=263 RepID=UPI0008F5208A|nr:hypothetical protein [Francisella tularensis]APA83260.1 hypothetical protein N894_1276 [Francisella tularensis subsp. novicida PA10-7858]
MSKKKGFNKIWDGIDDKDIVYDNDSHDLSKVDNYESMTFDQLENLRLASQLEYDEKEVKDKKLSVKVSESELKEIKEFWGKNYTAKVRKFLLDFIHHSEKKHT